MKRERYAFILIADKKYWNKLCERNKVNEGTHVFVRKSKVAPKTAQKLLFYVKKPVMQVKGIADFVERRARANWRQRRTVEKTRRRKLLRNVRRVLRFRTGQNNDDVCEVQELCGTRKPKNYGSHPKHSRLFAGIQRQIRESRDNEAVDNLKRFFSDSIT